MRRVFALVTIVGILGIASGCEHTAGVCDCETGPHANFEPLLAKPAPDQAKPEEIKSMPKSNL